ncbi:1-aminocyclopropane-1-carboxylate deaminase/D-cysteine desulfhydrase [Shewanella frigidimarina]|uniref:1-aminocyclopropane-1-carboxylate deaminase/D-cysteine desulfhydrase n=1 Tax=Shewanella frigidimarina TaxID=56812 RepID=UPI000F4D65CE|nr:1-aminocyclopropane-1-carboxylate deaminase/D-cysteine desulfhydrase [Shewanella frigidimarina]RPA34079.1 1-aminocyclopropane-1-carboxylate deaminase/D-cysteine desulfhydrase [Shewanella frigidimarina]|tara:strand:- start:746 stop:1717 length:972 start_codon:yes stop_codon:yes gene_type:complete
MFSISPVQAMNFEGRSIYIKRDDLLHADFGGNKARKFYHFLHHDYSHVIQIVASGSAQANSLYSLSVLAKQQGWKFDYYVSHISEFLLQHPQGNYAAAIQNGANIIDVRHLTDAENLEGMHLDDAMRHIVSSDPSYADKKQLLFIPEGGRCEYAETGIAQLASEIIQWAQDQQKKQLKIFLPSGTGTTAAYLNKQIIQQQAKLLLMDVIAIEVLTCSTVGGDEYLRQQFSQLVDEVYFPNIINDGHKYHFGKLSRRCFDMWNTVCQSGIEFELLYDPVGFLVLQHYLNSNTVSATDILYIHQGGVLGNKTMLPRYQRKFSHTV